MSRNNGGVRCLEDVRQRCHVDDFTECWNWKLGMSDNRCPTVWLPETRKIEQVTRVSYRLAFPKRPITGKLVWRACWNTECVNPEHLACGTTKEFGAAVRASGHQKGLPSKVAANVRMGKLRRKISEEQREEIAGSNETLDVLAERMNVSAFTISMYRRGLRGRGPINSSVFNWRPV